MKVAILCESSADEVALRIISNSILGLRTEEINMPVSLRARGWPAVRDILPTVLKFLQFRSDAQGLVVVVDSNHSPMEATSSASRLFDLKRIIQTQLQNLPSVSTRPLLRVAVGVAVPAIEAWLLSHNQSNVNENQWNTGLQTGTFPYSKVELKRRLYGSERYTLEHETLTMKRAAEELSGNLGELETKFPVGFGELAEGLRCWRRVAS